MQFCFGLYFRGPYNQDWRFLEEAYIWAMYATAVKAIETAAASLPSTVSVSQLQGFGERIISDLKRVRD